MKYFKGFMMAWGSFCSIPCPYHGWDEEARPAILQMFPALGLIYGILCTLVWWILNLLHAPAALAGVLVTAAYFYSTGFIHLDGFMDCNDAIMSRLPLEDKRRILKDSHVGAFAVITLAFMLLIFAASMTTLTEEFQWWKAATLTMVFILSREFSAWDVMTKPPMKTSQYYEMGQKKKSTGCIPGLIVTLICVLALLGLEYWLSSYDWKVLAFSLITILVHRIAAFWVGNSARKQLQGMNGDISGYMIVNGEMAALICMAILSKFANTITIF